MGSVTKVSRREGLATVAPAVQPGDDRRQTELLLPTDGGRAALEVIERNCGNAAGNVLLSTAALTPAEIAMLSRTSPEYQRHVVDRVRAGHNTPLKKTAECACIYETVSFHEVISRMERAAGAVRQETAFIAGQLEKGVPKLDRGADRLLTLDLIAEAAEDGATAICKLPETETTPSRPRDSRAIGVAPMHNNSGRLHAAAALGLLAKNVRNLPILQPEHYPTPEEKRLALRLCQDIATLARTALRAARQRWGHWTPNFLCAHLGGRLGE